MSGEHHNAYLAATGWAGKATTAGVFFWGLVGVVLSILSIFALWHIPESFMYGFTVVPGVNNGSPSMSQFDDMSDRLAFMVEGIFDRVGHVLILLYALLSTATLFDYIVMIYFCYIPTYLFFRYWSQDLYSTNHAHY